MRRKPHRRSAAGSKAARRSEEELALPPPPSAQETGPLVVIQDRGEVRNLSDATGPGDVMPAGSALPLEGRSDRPPRYSVRLALESDIDGLDRATQWHLAAALRVLGAPRVSMSVDHPPTSPHGLLKRPAVGISRFRRSPAITSR